MILYSLLARVIGILHKTWTLYWMSPLWKFHLPNLTSYSHTLSQYIASHDKRSISVKMAVLERFGRDGSAGVEITLSQNEGSVYR